MEIVLPGLIDIDPEEEFKLDYTGFPKDMDRELRRWLKIVPIKSTLDYPEDALKYKVTFEPMKPFKIIFDMIFFKKSGGRWK